MTNRSTTARLSRRDSEVTVSQHETDSPIIPVAHLQRLHQFKPEAVDWVISQTPIEAEDRRRETQRINTYVFIERTVGQVFAFLIGLCGVGGGEKRGQTPFLHTEILTSRDTFSTTALSGGSSFATIRSFSA